MAMTLALRHATYSAILNTEATASFMFLPARGKLTITNPCAKITAYPYLSYKLGTVLKGDLIYGNPQSWPRQENALPEHTWDLQVIAVWSTAARVQLDNQNPIWIQDLARDISEAKRFVKNVSIDLIHDSIKLIQVTFQCLE
eukprot:1137613-Pelagomonas_calceolata.AAC.10